MNSMLAFLAFAVLAAFLGVLVWFVPRADLGTVVGLTLIAAARDFVPAILGRAK